MVDTYHHPSERRVNIPTSENQAFIPDDEKAARLKFYERNPDLDPQLVWRGKDEEDPDRLTVQAPPVYIQEKIHPKAIVADLRRRSEAAQPVADQASLFSDFNGLPDDWRENATDSYYHDEGNWSNRMILGDSLLVMASLAEREALTGRVQTIFLDPPYGIKFNSNWQPSTKSRDVKDGKAESVSREPEVVRAFRDTWKDGIHSYLSYMRDRIVAGRDLLADSGSIFVQIGDENVHFVRSLLDEVFGRDNFIAQIAFTKGATGLASADRINARLDYIVWYARNAALVKYRELYDVRSIERDPNFAWVETPDGHRRRLSADERGNESALPAGSRFFQDVSLTKPGPGAKYSIRFQGRDYEPGNRWWGTTKPQLERMCRSGRVVVVGNSIRQIRYQDESSLSALGNLWDGLLGQSDPVYVVQTNVRVVERCILMTTDPGDLVLDPTCGSGTTAYVAEQWGRRWITMDTSRVALALARTRLMSAKYDWYLLRDSSEGAAKESALSGRQVAGPPAGHRADIQKGFVYERAPRVTLRSIANNAEIDVISDKYSERLQLLLERLNGALGQRWQEWEIPREAGSSWPETAKADHVAWWTTRAKRQADLDASIARGADVEMLYDRPYKAKGVVRVAGPFTVESLSPHRVLPLEEDPNLLAALAEDEEDEQAEGPLHQPSNSPSPRSGEEFTDFAQVVYQNLKAAGVQNSKKGEAVRFEWLKPFASRKGYVAFEGRYLENGIEKRAAVAVGPEYDTVGYEFVRRAAREAADLFDTLIVCGFAFAPEVDESRLNFGGLTVLKARMNQDLRMGDKLKATGAGNLFVVFGEPDISIEEADEDMIRIRINGVDIFDPTSGEVRSSADPAEDIACWFIDDDYDEESFFVRQAYFLGRDPYESLKRALKAEIDEAAWAELNSTVSRAFPRPKSGRVCVKVINHFGDEVQKVFDVRAE
jgi:adenine-specific DNA-methyltransferase